MWIANCNHHFRRRGLNPNPKQVGLGVLANHFEGRIRVRDRVRVSLAAPFGRAAFQNVGPESVWVMEVP